MTRGLTEGQILAGQNLGIGVPPPAAYFSLGVCLCVPPVSTLGSLGQLS
jgi:hypothetical protein